MCIKNETEEERKARELDNKITRSIQNQRNEYESEVKLLLLGAGESGKSTIFKQMRIINLSDYSDDEKSEFKEIIYSNVITDIYNLVEGAKKLNIEVKYSEEFLKEVDDLFRFGTTQALKVYTPEVAKKISELWNDKGIQEAYVRRAEFQLNDSASYFLNKCTEIVEKKYVPTTEDILHSRKRTTGCVESSFKIEKNTFKILDVGGQRMERKKWMKVLDNVNALLFIASLSEYNQVLMEDETTNRMQESLDLFEEVLSLPYFTKTTIMIFFNKEDLFKEKIKTIDLKICFSQYEGGCDEMKAKKYIEEKFMSRSKRKDIGVHYTTATDTNIMKKVFSLIRTAVLRSIIDKYQL